MLKCSLQKCCISAQVVQHCIRLFGGRLFFVSNMVCAFVCLLACLSTEVSRSGDSSHSMLNPASCVKASQSQTTSPWLACQASRHQLDITDLLPGNTMPVNSIDIVDTTLLCASDAEQIICVQDLVITWNNSFLCETPINTIVYLGLIAAAKAAIMHVKRGPFTTHVFIGLYVTLCFMVGAVFISGMNKGLASLIQQYRELCLLLLWMNRTP